MIKLTSPLSNTLYTLSLYANFEKSEYNSAVFSLSSLSIILNKNCSNVTFLGEVIYPCNDYDLMNTYMYSLINFVKPI